MTASLLFLGSFMLSGSLFAMAMLLVTRAPEKIFAPNPRPETAPANTGDAAELRRQLAQAGFTHPDAPRYFQRIRIGLVAVAFLITATGIFSSQMVSCLTSQSSVGVAVLALSRYSPINCPSGS